MKSYCMKQRKQTECIKPSGYKKAKKWRLVFFCTCPAWGIKKTRFVKNHGNKTARTQGQEL